MDFISIVKKMRDVGPRIKSLQQQMQRAIVEVEEGEGKRKLRVVFNGHGEILQINIGPELMQDKAELEECLARLISKGNEQVKETVRKELREILGGISIPGLEKLF